MNCQSNLIQNIAIKHVEVSKLAGKSAEDIDILSEVRKFII